jgi:hypothetical protein
MHKPKSTTQLPAHYQLLKEINLSKNTGLMVVLSIASIGLFFLFGFGVMWLMSFIRPEIIQIGFDFSIGAGGIGSLMLFLIIILGVTLVMVVVHEAVHGVFFKAFTGGKIKYGFKGMYAYAAAPDWYISKMPYMVISLAPLVIITVLCLAALLIVPSGWFLPIFLLLTMNGSGAAGDIYVFLWLLGQRGNVLIQDFGDHMKVFAPGESQI